MSEKISRNQLIEELKNDKKMLKLEVRLNPNLAGIAWAFNELIDGVYGRLINLVNELPTVDDVKLP